MVLLTVVVCVVSGCGRVDEPSAQAYAERACAAYRDTGRVQVATTSDQAVAIRDVARANARAAAAFDSRWSPLYADIAAALDALGSGPDAEAGGADLVEDDRRVQEQCREAGVDIGDLVP